MRITHSEGEHFLGLTDAEAAVLVEVSALLVVASQSVEALQCHQGWQRCWVNSLKVSRRTVVHLPLLGAIEVSGRKNDAGSDRVPGSGVNPWGPQPRRSRG